MWTISFRSHARLAHTSDDHLGMGVVADAKTVTITVTQMNFYES